MVVGRRAGVGDVKRVVDVRWRDRGREDGGVLGPLLGELVGFDGDGRGEYGAVEVDERDGDVALKRLR